MSKIQECVEKFADIMEKSGVARGTSKPFMDAFAAELLSAVREDIPKKARILPAECFLSEYEDYVLADVHGAYNNAIDDVNDFLTSSIERLGGGR